MLNYQELVRTLGKANDSRIAIEDADKSYTYGEWHRDTTRVAAGFIQHGLQPGDAVVWLSPNCADYLIAYFGTAKAGLRFSPLNFWLRVPELRAALELVRPACIIVHPDYLDKMTEVCEGMEVDHRFVLADSEASLPMGWRPWDGLFVDTDPDAVFESDENSPHEIIFTSGTTGQVKGVARTQRQRIMEAIVSVMVQPQGRRSFVLRGAPQFHVGGGTGPLQTLLQGGRTRIYKFNPRRAAGHLRDGITQISGVPAQFQLLFESGALDGVDTGKIRYCGIGGNGAAPDQFLQIQKAFPNAQLVHFYGSTESGMVSSISGDEFHERLSSIGRPAPGVEVRIVDDHGAELRPGEVGEVQVKSEFLMTEYYRRPDLTAEALTDDGFLKMGDLARMDDEGYLYIVGRKKDMIISGGENIYPKEVEDVITTVTDVAEVAIIGVPDPIFEERALGIVKLAGNVVQTEDDIRQTITERVREELAGYKAPREVHFVDEFPRNALGKIDKVALRKQYSGALNAC